MLLSGNILSYILLLRQGKIPFHKGMLWTQLVPTRPSPILPSFILLPQLIEAILVHINDSKSSGMPHASNYPPSSPAYQLRSLILSAQTDMAFR